MPLFAHAAPAMAEPAPAPLDPGAAAVLDQLRALDPDALTPREALDLVYNLAELAKGDASDV